MNEKQRRPVKVFFDGGCRPNPGAMETAVVLRGVTEIRRDLGDGNSERAEWLALLHALAAARGEYDIILVGDSLQVIRQAKGTLSCPAEWLTKFREAARPFDRIRLRHVKRSRNPAGAALERARWMKAP